MRTKNKVKKHKIYVSRTVFWKTYKEDDEMLSTTTRDPPKIEVKIVTKYDDYLPHFYRTF